MNWRSGITSLFTSWKLLIFVLVSLMVLVLTSSQGYIVSKQSTKTIEQQYNQIIVENMESLSVNLSNYLNYIDDFARTLSNNPDLLAILQRDDSDKKQKAEEQVRTFSEYYHLRLPVNVQIFNDREDIYAFPSLNVWEEQRIKQTVGGFPWFAQRVALDNNYLHWNVAGDYHDGVHSNVLYVSKNMISNNHSIGLLVMELNGSLIERMLDRAQINDQNPIFIFSGSSQTLFHNENIPASLAGDSGALRSVYQQIKAQNKDSGSLNVRLAGVDYRLLYRQIASTPWTMVSLIPPYLLHADSVSIWRITAVMTAVSVLFIVIFFGILHVKVTRPVRHLSSMVRQSEDGGRLELYAYKGFREIETLNQGIYQFLIEIQKQFHTIKRGEAEKRRLELQRLQEQMRPHFWHNSLNSLRFLAVLHGDPTMAEAILSLTRMLDYTLRNTDVSYSTLEVEMEYAMSFVRFQEIRSMKQYQVELDVDKQTLQALLPKFTIQPILENAIIHGFAAPSSRDPRMRISARMEGHALVITLSDNGQGIEPAVLRRLSGRERSSSRRSAGGLSIVNLQERFRLEYGEPYGIEIDSRLNEGTQVELKLPYQTMNQQEEGTSS